MNLTARAAFGLLLISLISVRAAEPADSSDPIRSDPDRLARLRAAKMPKIQVPIHFNVPEADAVLAALKVFPPNNPWNTPVDHWPLAANSKAMIAVAP